MLGRHSFLDGPYCFGVGGAGRLRILVRSSNKRRVRSPVQQNHKRVAVRVGNSTIILALMNFSPTLMRVQFWRMNVLPFVSRIVPANIRRFILDLMPWKDAHHLCDMADYMSNVGGEIFESKKLALEKGDEAVAQQIGRGKDLISILSEIFKVHRLSSLIVITVKENMKASDEDRLEDSELLSQVVIDT